MAELHKGTDFHGALPESRQDAREDGGLWEFAHMYDVVRADETELANVIKVDDELHAHEKVKATADTLGHVKVGDNISVTEDGTISTHAPYELPVAGNETLGGVKIKPGTGLEIVDGVLIADSSGGLSELDVSSIKTDSSARVNNDFAIYMTSQPQGAYKTTTDSPTFYAGSAPFYTGENLDSRFQIMIPAGSIVTLSDFYNGQKAYRLMTCFSAVTPHPSSTLFNEAMNIYCLVDLSTSMPTGYFYARGMTSYSKNKSQGYVWSQTLGPAYSLDLNIADTTNPGIVKASTSITADSDGTIKVNPSIFSDGLTATDAQVSADLGFIGEHLAGDALYYDSTGGLMVKTGTGLHVDNDALSIDTDALPLASASTRGTVKVGSGLAIADDGTLSATGGGSTSASGVKYVGMLGCTGSTGIAVLGVNVLANYDDSRASYDVISATFALSTNVTFTAGTTATVTMGSGYSFDTTDYNTFWECVSSIDGVSATLTNGTTVTLAFTKDVPASTEIHLKIR